MGDVIVSLLPLIVGTAIVPVWIIVVLLLLSSQNGLVKAGAFVAGAMAVRLGQGLVIGPLLGASEAAAEGEDGGQGPVVSTLLLVVGILMLVTAFRTVTHHDDPDAPPPKWMSMLDSLTPLKAFGFGAVLLLLGAKHWVFTLSAIGVIRAADLDRAQNVIAFLIYVLGAELLLLTPIVAYALAPKQLEAGLQAATTWLERHN